MFFDSRRLLTSWCKPSETRAARRAATTSVDHTPMLQPRNGVCEERRLLTPSVAQVSRLTRNSSPACSVDATQGGGAREGLRTTEPGRREHAWGATVTRTFQRSGSTESRRAYVGRIRPGNRNAQATDTVQTRAGLHWEAGVAPGPLHPKTPQGDQPRFERGREVMEPEACESATGRGTTGAPALVTLPHYASPVGGPMGTGYPAAAGPACGHHLPTLCAASSKSRERPSSSRTSMARTAARPHALSSVSSMPRMVRFFAR